MTFLKNSGNYFTSVSFVALTDIATKTVTAGTGHKQQEPEAMNSV